VSRRREPAQILELRGSFKAHPERQRTDSEGNGPLNPEPPAHLPQGAVAAWRYLVERLPKITISESDAVAVEMCARLLAQCWLNPEVGALRELRQWLSALGMSPQARTKIPSARGAPSESRFGQLREDLDDQ
jgi:phage terminase small subunit